MKTHIIIVNYNSGEWLTRSVLSALQHSDAHISVVDNASVDSSVEAAKQAASEYSARLNWVENSDNLGFAAANNQILRDVDADYVVLMNPDCELSSNTLAIMRGAFEDNPQFGLASGRILNEDGTLQTTCRRKFPTPWTALVRMLKLHVLFPNNPKFENFDYGDSVHENDPVTSVEAISGAFMMVRRVALADVGLLDEGYFMHCEDLDWCKRFQLGGWQVGFVPQATVIHAKGVSSKSRPIGVLWTLHKGMNRFFDKFYRNEVSWSLRLMVKLGIYVSFIARSLSQFLGRLTRRVVGK